MGGCGRLAQLTGGMLPFKRTSHHFHGTVLLSVSIASNGANTIVELLQLIDNVVQAFRKQLHYRATPGCLGGGSNRHGANGADLEIRVCSG